MSSLPPRTDCCRPLSSSAFSSAIETDLSSWTRADRNPGVEESIRVRPARGGTSVGKPAGDWKLFQLFCLRECDTLKSASKAQLLCWAGQKGAGTERTAE